MQAGWLVSRSARAVVAVRGGEMRAIKAPRSLHAGACKAALLSISSVALAAAIPITTHAQAPGASQLPPVQIDEPERKPRRQQAAPRNRSPATAPRTPWRNPTRTAEPAPRSAPIDTQDTRTGTVGVY